MLPALMTAIKTRQVAIESGLEGIMTVRSTLALNINCNPQEHSKLKFVWDILELFGMEVEGLNDLITKGVRESLIRAGLEKGFMRASVVEEKQFPDKVVGLTPLDICKIRGRTIPSIIHEDRREGFGGGRERC